MKLYYNTFTGKVHTGMKIFTENLCGRLSFIFKNNYQ